MLMYDRHMQNYIYLLVHTLCGSFLYLSCVEYDMMFSASLLALHNFFYQIFAFRYFRPHITMRTNLVMDGKSSDSKHFLARENTVLALMNNLNLSSCGFFCHLPPDGNVGTWESLSQPDPTISTNTNFQSRSFIHPNHGQRFAFLFEGRRLEVA